MAKRAKKPAKGKGKRTKGNSSYRRAMRQISDAVVRRQVRSAKPRVDVMRPETAKLARLWESRIDKIAARRVSAPLVIRPEDVRMGGEIMADEIAERAKKLKRPVIVLMGGGGATGKSTLTDRMTSADELRGLLVKRGISRGQIATVELDHYFKPINEVAVEDGKYDNPLNSYLDIARRNLSALRRNRPTFIPVHDRKAHGFTRTGRYGRKIDPKDSNIRVVICEGLYALSPDLHDLGDVRIYVETPNVERVRRRFTRDKWVRERSDAHIADMLLGRQPYHQAFVEVTRPAADYIYQTPETAGSIEVVPKKFGRLRRYARAAKTAGLDAETRRRLIAELEAQRRKEIEGIKKQHF